jgi:hypothetical protein
MTLGNSSQPRAHLNFESVFDKLKQPAASRATGGKREIWQQESHAEKMQKVREALEMAEKKLEKYRRKKPRALVDEVMAGGGASAAAAGLPPFPAAPKKRLSLLAAGEKGDDDEDEADAMDDDDDDDSTDDANGGVGSDGGDSAGQETDEEVEEEDGKMVAAANAKEAAASSAPAAAASIPTEEHLPPSRNGSYGSAQSAGFASSAQRMLHSPHYSPLWSPIRSDAMDASGLGLASLECATVPGGLNGSLSPWNGVVSSISASVSASVDDAEHGIHDFAMPLLDVDAAWHRWMRTE